MASEKWGLSVESLSQNDKIIEGKFENTLTSTMDASASKKFNSWDGFMICIANYC